MEETPVESRDIFENIKLKSVIRVKTIVMDIIKRLLLLHTSCKKTLILSTLLMLLLYPCCAPGSIHPGFVPGKTKENSLSFVLKTPSYNISVNKRGVTKLTIKGFGYLNSPGNPRVPRKIYVVAVPPDVDAKTIQLKVLNINFHLLPGSYDIPAVAPLATCSNVKQISWGKGKNIKNGRNIGVYAYDYPYPKKPVQIESITKLGRWKIIRISYCPFRYHPKSKTLEFIKQVNLEIQYKRSTSENVSLIRNRVPVTDDSLVCNSSQAESWYSSPEPLSTSAIHYDYVIITTDNIMNHSTKLYDFKTFKESLGHSVLIVTEDQYGTLTGQNPNGKAEKIREWLKENYESMGITYVLLIGDPDPYNGNVPMKMCWPRNHESNYKEAPTDYYYADLTGNWDLDGDGNFGEYEGDRGTGGVDFDAEVYVGRIPVYNNDYDALDNILQKIIYYESETGDLAWRKTALLPMGILNFMGEPSYSYARTDGAELGRVMIADYLSRNGFSTYSLYEKEGIDSSTYWCDASLNRSNVRTEWGTGYGLVCWVGHGSQTGTYRKYWGSDENQNGIPESGELTTTTFFQSSDASYLDDSYPSMVYECSCSNGYPENSNNLGYALLKHGAISTVSASRVSWYTIGWDQPDPNYGDNSSIGYYYMEKLVQNIPCGEALANTKRDLVSNSAEVWLNLLGFNLYGDPSVNLINAIIPCLSDRDYDMDVDGLDLANIAIDSGGVSLEEFAKHFGETACK